jgi:hypothetical protein
VSGHHQETVTADVGSPALTLDLVWLSDSVTCTEYDGETNSASAFRLLDGMRAWHGQISNVEREDSSDPYSTEVEPSGKKWTSR